jgi:excisionase family DNA binding protein
MARDMNPDTPEVSEIALLTDIGQAKRPATALRPRYVSIDDACRYMGVGKSKFYRDFLRRLRTLRIGRRNLVELDAVDEVLDQLRAEQP